MTTLQILPGDLVKIAMTADDPYAVLKEAWIVDILSRIVQDSYRDYTQYPQIEPLWISINDVCVVVQVIAPRSSRSSAYYKLLSKHGIVYYYNRLQTP